jgi:glycosyltransferase involved in cell wall biosynthesis
MGYTSIKDDITCIIPFYNEDAKNLLKIINTASSIGQISNIIVVDDGSISKSTFYFLKKSLSLNKKVKLVRHKKNQGKAFAVKFGLSFAFTDNVILLDADIKNLDKYQVLGAIIKFKSLDLDMLILRRIESLPLVKLIRADTLLSGERIIKVKHLQKILSTDVEGYQLEVATNQYFMENTLHNRCSWSASHAVNNYKFRKFKFIKGMGKDLKMYFNLINYIGLRNFVKQVLFFCKETI